MKPILLLAACAAIASSLITRETAAQETAPPKTTLRVGQEAPDFSLPDTENKQVKLSDFRGKKVVVLAFFPAAFTGG